LAEDINPPSCIIEDLENDVLIKICKRVGYHQKSNPTREQLVIAANVFLESSATVGLDLNSYERAIEVQAIEKMIKYDTLERRLYLDYLDMMKELFFIAKSKHNRISYLLAKHGIDDIETKATIRELLLISLHSKIETYPYSMPTPEEIASLPELKSNEEIGFEDGQLKAFQKKGNSLEIFVARWSVAGKKWIKPLAISELDYEQGKHLTPDGWNVLECINESIQYDQVVQLEITLREGVNEKVIIGFDNDDDPLNVAQDVVDLYYLDQYKLPSIAARIRERLVGEGHDDPTDKFYTPSDIPLLFALSHQKIINDKGLLDAAVGIRKLLSEYWPHPVKEVLASGILPHLVQMLSHDMSAIIFEAVNALALIAITATGAESVVDAGAVPQLIQLLSYPLNEDVRTASARCLGSIAGASTRLRDVVKSFGGLQQLIRNIAEFDNIDQLNEYAFVLDIIGISSGGDEVWKHIGEIAPAIPMLARIFKSDSSTDMDKKNALSAIGIFADAPPRIQIMLDSGILNELVSTMSSDDWALRVIGNLVFYGTDDQTQVVMNAGIMPKIQPLLYSPKRIMNRWGCRMLAKIGKFVRNTHHMHTFVTATLTKPNINSGWYLCTKTSSS